MQFEIRYPDSQRWEPLDEQTAKRWLSASYYDVKAVVDYLSAATINGRQPEAYTPTGAAIRLVRPPQCPVCGASMRQIRRGATLRRWGPGYVCPVAEAERQVDERGHIQRRADARHERVAVWSLDQLESQ